MNKFYLMNTQTRPRQHKIEQVIFKADRATTRLRDDPASTQRLSEYQQAKVELKSAIVELREALEAILPSPSMTTANFNNR